MAKKNTTLIIIIVMTVIFCSSMVSASSGGAMLFLPGLTSMFPGAGAAGGGGSEVTFENIPRAEDGCVVLYDEAKGGGDNTNLCLDDRSTAKIVDLKNVDMKDKASAVDVGAGVKAYIYPDADFKGTPYVVSKPGYVFLGDVWKDNVASSLRLVKQ